MFIRQVTYKAIGMKMHRVGLFADTLRLAISDQGEGAAFLVLHGGAGPASVAGLADALSGKARVIVPVIPGFNGEPRPDWLGTIDDLALVYLALITQLDLSNVVIVGNSVGGWIAAEMALRQSPRIAGLVLLNAVGIDTGSAQRVIVNPMKLPPNERAALAFHDPARFAGVPSSPEALAVMARNQSALATYAGDPFMHDPGLRSRLAGMRLPVVVAWGENDRIVDVEYGRLFAASIPQARFELIPKAGHFPQIEQGDAVMQCIADFTTQLGGQA
jgi:pimeloyl-ACP methyl ester carboxylesterase